MATITIATGDIETYQGDESAPLLRIFVSKNFTASDGDDIMRSTPESGDFYDQHACSVAANVVTYPSFTIKSTADALSNPSDAKYRFDLFTAAGQFIQNVHKNQRVPATPTSTTLGAIAAHNQANASPPVTGSYTTAQTDTFISGLQDQIDDLDTTADDLQAQIDDLGGLGLSIAIARTNYLR
jgi:hypothetical protein